MQPRRSDNRKRGGPGSEAVPPHQNFYVKVLLRRIFPNEYSGFRNGLNSPGDIEWAYIEEYSIIAALGFSVVVLIYRGSRRRPYGKQRRTIIQHNSIEFCSMCRD